MNEGRLEQVGPAEQLYHHPATEFVATFLGRVGAVDGVAEASFVGGGLSCRLAGGVTWPALAPEGHESLPQGTTVRLLARPEALTFTPADTDGALRGQVGDRRFAGSVYIYTVMVEGGALEVQSDGDVARVGATVGVRPRSAPAGLFAFPHRPDE